MQSEVFNRTVPHAASMKTCLTVGESFCFLFQSRAARAGYEQDSKERIKLWRGEQESE